MIVTRDEASTPRDENEDVNAVSPDDARERSETVEELANAPDIGRVLDDINHIDDADDAEHDPRRAIYSKGVTIQPPS
jgi:hypothetical protein